MNQDNNEIEQKTERKEDERWMYQKDPTYGNTERAQETEKLTANAKDGKHIRRVAQVRQEGTSPKNRKTSNVTQNQK
jgi:hypothetical protein